MTITKNIYRRYIINYIDSTGKMAKVFWFKNQKL